MKNASDVFYYINLVLEWGNIPDELLEVMIKDVYFAYYYGVYILGGIGVPEKVLRVIESDDEYRDRYLKYKYKYKYNNKLIGE